MRGQTIIELLIAVVLFVIVVSGFAFFILDSYAAGRLAKELTIANSLAQEGLEATRSIRDNSWNDLAVGNHGLAISDNVWVFQDIEEDIGGLLGSGKRKIIVENLNPPDNDRKKITSQITWQFTPQRPESVALVTYFTNWEKSAPYLKQLRYRWRNDNGGE